MTPRDVLERLRESRDKEQQRFGDHGDGCDCDSCAAIREITRLRAEVERLTAALQSKQDYGPASPGEQEAAWLLHCRRMGWAPDTHPSAKDAFVEGYISGDAFSTGDETVGNLRAQLAAAKERAALWTAADEHDNADVERGAHCACAFDPDNPNVGAYLQECLPHSRLRETNATLTARVTALEGALRRCRPWIESLPLGSHERQEQAADLCEQIDATLAGRSE